MAARIAPVWLLRVVLVGVTAAAVAVMHSLPTWDAADPVTATAALTTAGAEHGQPAYERATHPHDDHPDHPDDTSHGIEHLCFAVLTAVVAGLTMMWAVLGGRGPVTVDGPAVISAGERAPPAAGRSLLTHLCVIRV